MTPVDHPGMRERMDTIRLKQLLGAALKPHELMCLQIEHHGYGCPACGRRHG